MKKYSSYIDVHHHYNPLSLLELPKNIRQKILKEESGSMDISRNLDVMEKLGIEKSILSYPVWFPALTEQESLVFCTQVNECYANLISEHSSLGAFALLPESRNQELVLETMEYALKSLAVHELRGWPSLMEGKVNRCHDRFGWWGDEETIRRAFQDRSVLKNATDSETYDLTPTWENYYRLTDADKGLGLTRSPYNYDRMTLLYIMDKGYPRDGLTDEYPDEFSFHEKFEKIENKLLGRNRWDVYDEMQEKAKKLAGKLLKEHFPETRQKADMKEKAAMRKSKGMKM